MRVAACFAYDDVTAIISKVEEAVAIQLKSDKDITLAIVLQPMQCKILGEALINIAGYMPVGHRKGELSGSMQVEFELEDDQEEVLCQLQDLFVQTDKLSQSKIA